MSSYGFEEVDVTRVCVSAHWLLLLHTCLLERRGCPLARPTALPKACRWGSHKRVECGPACLFSFLQRMDLGLFATGRKAHEDKADMYSLITALEYLETAFVRGYASPDEVRSLLRV